MKDVCPNININFIVTMHLMVGDLEKIIRGQRINSIKLDRARLFRQNMTEAERELWIKLKGNRLGGFHFRRQQIIEGFIADFYCHAARLVIEVDGEIHRLRVEADQDRDRVFESKGIMVLRFQNNEVTQSLPNVLDKIRILCLKRSAFFSTGDF